MNGKLGQFEIMGLAVIVILVMLGVLFALSTLSGNDENLQTTFEQKRLITDFITASLNTQAAKCAQAPLRELFQDCAQSRAIRCTLDNGQSVNACAFLKETYKTLFGATFETYRQKYYFEVKGPCSGEAGELCQITQGNVMDAAGVPGPCPGELEFSSQPLPTRVGTIVLSLQVCS